MAPSAQSAAASSSYTATLARIVVRRAERNGSNRDSEASTSRDMTPAESRSLPWASYGLLGHLAYEGAFFVFALVGGEDGLLGICA